MGAPQPGVYLFFEARRGCGPASGKGPHHDPLRRVEVGEHRSNGVPETTGHAVSIHCPANGFRHDETDPGGRLIGVPIGVHHDIRLRSPHPVLDGVAELRRPGHPVARREHSARTSSGSQRATALAAPAGHDRAPGAGPHAQPETVNPGAPPVVWLERPLALGHGCLSSHLAPASRSCAIAGRYARC